MRWLRWFPWRYAIRRLALSQGFLDPVLLLARLSRFGQPSEVAAPTELLRASAVLHARGLINSQTIQYNLDWVWPYWVVRQFDPKDLSFIPRAFSLTHINLTHRNWTAVGLPDLAEFPIVDPRGLVTPLFDGWSIEGWLVAEGRAPLVPSREREVRQRLLLDGRLAVVTQAESGGLRLESTAEVVRVSDQPVCRVRFTAESPIPARLVLSLRPYNPEGISFVHEIRWEEPDSCFRVDGRHRVIFLQRPDGIRFSQFHQGDVFHHLTEPPREPLVRCAVGMATAAAVFSVRPAERTERMVDIPLGHAAPGSIPEGGEWDRALSGACRLQIPDPLWQSLYEAAVHALILHAPGDLYPGPYTYKRFWFRDAAFLLHALSCVGLADRAEKAIGLFHTRQTPSGYFLSQEGEWDSNGEALWAIDRVCALSGRPLKLEWKEMIYRAARWIHRKRLPSQPESPHAGLLPPGYSAEHLGPSDYYYWDDFWGVAGLQAAARLARAYGDEPIAAGFDREAADFLRAIEQSLTLTAARLGHRAMPASPYRRMDPGAIGSTAAGYPLHLWDADHPRLRATVEFLLSRCFFRGGFFQDLSHSGINPYLTMAVAQILLRAVDSRAASLAEQIADRASPTGQWPEAIHPWTGGGCMGDGQHLWASAEWLLWIRNLFVREEGTALVLGSGLPRDWLTRRGAPLLFGPAPTAFGTLSLQVEPDPRHPVLSWSASWRTPPSQLRIHVPGGPLQGLPADSEGSVRMTIS